MIVATGTLVWFVFFSKTGITVSPSPSVTASPTVTPSTSSQNLAKPIRVDNIKPDDAIHSPLLVEGAARGNWFFEASFPIVLLDGNGREISQAPAQAQGDWMTTNFVSFEAELLFDYPGTPTGTLILKTDDPSGLPRSADDELRIPIRFVSN